MKKTRFFITAEATKYWKKEVKNGVLRVATSGEKIYIVNGYNAFVIPNNNHVFETLVQPATLRPAPEDGRAYFWSNGTMREDDAKSTVELVEKILAAGVNDPVYRTQFCVDTATTTCRIFKLNSGTLAAIDTRFDVMVDYTFSHGATMANNKAPAVFRSDDFAAILPPVNLTTLGDQVRKLAEV